jgi:2-polyprenyl-3-methyl-5-hydroxy-6-metoxy-1,4-benzoquinol methylase
MEPTKENYVHGYNSKENTRLQDQSSTLVELLHDDTAYSTRSQVLEAGCGVGAQTIPLAHRSPDARITAIDISESSVAEAKERAESAGIMNASFQQGDIFNLAFEPEWQCLVKERAVLGVRCYATPRTAHCHIGARSA